MYFLTNKDGIIVAASNKLFSAIGARDICSIANMMKEQTIYIDEEKDELKIPAKNLEFNFTKSVMHSSLGEFILYSLTEFKEKSAEEENILHLKKIKEGVKEHEDNEFAIPDIPKEEKNEELLNKLEALKTPKEAKESKEAQSPVAEDIKSAADEISETETEKPVPEIETDIETAAPKEQDINILEKIEEQSQEDGIQKIAKIENGIEKDSTDEDVSGLKKITKKLFPWSSKDENKVDIELEDSDDKVEVDIKSAKELEKPEDKSQTEEVQKEETKEDESISHLLDSIANIETEHETFEAKDNKTTLPPIPDHVIEESLKLEEELNKGAKPEEDTNKAEKELISEIETLEIEKEVPETEEQAVIDKKTDAKTEEIKEKLTIEIDETETETASAEHKPEPETPNSTETKSSIKTLSLETDEPATADLEQIEPETEDTQPTEKENMVLPEEKPVLEESQELIKTVANIPETQKTAEEKNKISDTEAFYNILKHEVENIDFEENAKKLSIDLSSYKMLANNYIEELQRYKSDLEKGVSSTIKMLEDAGELLSLKPITNKLATLKNSSNPDELLNKIMLLASLLKTELKKDKTKDKIEAFDKLTENKEPEETFKHQESEISKEKTETDLELKQTTEPKTEKEATSKTVTTKEDLNKVISEDIIELTDAETLLETIPSQPVSYDPTKASEELNLPANLILEFVNDFISQAKEHLPVLIDSYNKENLISIQTTAHMLKGAASNLRLNSIAENLFKIQKENSLENSAKLIKQFAAKLKGLESEMKDLEEADYEN